jgi:IclR family KDG regulon transcriptional repressor
MVNANAPKGVTVQSVERAVSALQVFFEEGSPLSVTGVVAKTGLASATVHRLLSTLVKTGWLEQDPKSARYELSLKMLGSAAMVLASSPLRSHGRHFLSGISEATGLNSYLAVLIRRGSVLLARVRGKAGSTSDPTFQIGKTLPFHASASGKLFLAFLPEGERHQLLARQGELRRITPYTIVDPQRLADELEAIQHAGYAVDRGEMYEGYRSIAVPVRKAAGDVVAALCCGGWLNQLAEDFEGVLLREMIPAAEEFSRVFGQFEPW